MTLQSCTLHRDAMGASSINPSHHTMHMRLAFSQPCCLARRNVARNAIKTRATAENTASIKDRPDWTGQSSLSTAVNFITRIPIVKQAAKSLFKNSMAKQGVDWDSFIYALDAVRPEVYTTRGGSAGGYAWRSVCWVYCVVVSTFSQSSATFSHVHPVMYILSCTSSHAHPPVYIPPVGGDQAAHGGPLHTIPRLLPQGLSFL